MFFCPASWCWDKFLVIDLATWVSSSSSEEYPEPMISLHIYPQLHSTAATISPSSRKQTFHSVQLWILARNYSFHKWSQKRWGWQKRISLTSAQISSLLANPRWSLQFSLPRCAKSKYILNPCCCQFQRLSKFTQSSQTFKGDHIWTHGWYMGCIINIHFKLMDHGRRKKHSHDWHSSTVVTR